MEQNRRFLYVEDSLTAQFVLSKLLPEVSFDFAVCPRDAGTLLESSEYDLVFCDHHLKGGTAFDVIHHIRGNSSIAHLPIIVVSASMDRELATSLIRAGANATFSKPFDPTLLRQQTTNLLCNPNFREETAAPFTSQCLTWTDQNGHHVYCPDLNTVTAGASLNEATERLRQALQHRRDEVGYQYNHRVIEVRF